MFAAQPNQFAVAPVRWHHLKRLVVAELGPDGFGLLSRARQMQRKQGMDFESAAEVSEFMLALELLATPAQHQGLERVLDKLAQ